jgi:hypothetical protein
MKKLTIYFLYTLCTIFMISCGANKTQELISESSDKSNNIKISGSRQTSMDPFQTSITYTGYGQTKTVVTEVFAGDLTKENVLFSWSDNNNCSLTFIQQDDTKRTMNINFDSSGNSLTPTN